MASWSRWTANRSAGKLVLTLGPWACAAFEGLGLPLKPRRIPVVCFDTQRPEAFDREGFAVCFRAAPEGIFAGKPHLDHLGAMLLRHDDADAATHESARRVVTDADLAEVRGFAARRIPGPGGRIRSSFTCTYSMTPENHSIDDRHCDMPDALIATGFSGHGLEFAPVIGEALADLALDGQTALAVGFLRADRFVRAPLAPGQSV